jgi:hypothetical protein
MYEVASFEGKLSFRERLHREPDHQPASWLWIAIGAWIFLGGLTAETTFAMIIGTLTGASTIVRSLAELLPTSWKNPAICLRYSALVGYLIGVVLVGLSIVS